MATGARVERPQRHQNQQFRERIPRHEKPRHKRWIWRLGFFLIALATLAWFLPAIIVNTPVLGWVVRKASGSLKCAISVQSASLGWLSPISISGIAVRDEQNQALVEVERITSDKTLFAILSNYTQLGEFRLERPTVSLVLREGGSNVEDLLANFKSNSDTPETKSSDKRGDRLGRDRRHGKDHRPGGKAKLADRQGERGPEHAGQRGPGDDVEGLGRD